MGKILGVAKDSIQVEQTFDNSIQASEIPFPCLLTMEQNSCVPRLPSFLLKKKTAQKAIDVFGFADLPSPDLSRCGLIGSPTKVDAMFPPEAAPQRVMLDGENPATALFDLLQEKKFIQGGSNHVNTTI